MIINNDIVSDETIQIIRNKAIDDFVKMAKDELFTSPFPLCEVDLDYIAQQLKEGAVSDD